MNYGLRGDGVVEDVDGDCPPQDGRIVGDDDDNDFLLQGGSSPGGITPPEGKSAPPKFRLEAAALRPEIPLLSFSRSK